MKTTHLIVLIVIVGVIFFVASQADAGWFMAGNKTKNKPIIQGG